MDNIVLRFIFDKKKKADNTTTGLLQVEARLKGTNKSVYISTDIHLLKHQFSDKNGFTCVKHERAGQINAKAREVYRKVEAFSLSDKCHKLEDIKNYDTVQSYSYSVAEFIRERMRFVTNTSLQKHRNLLNKIEEFGAFRTFADLTYINLLDFDAFLRTTIKSQPTLYKYHTYFKSYINMAAKAGLTNYSPYSDFQFKRGQHKDPVFLTEDELHKIEKWEPATERLERVRDVFVFQCYTGLAYVDLAKFSKDDISNHNGHEIIRSNRQKTDQAFVSILLPKAKGILIKYNYDLPVISNAKYNDYLKLVGDGAGITKVITTHVARHTYATYLINNGISIMTVSKALGHSNTKMSERYAKLLANTVIDELATLKTK